MNRTASVLLLALCLLLPVHSAWADQPSEDRPRVALQISDHGSIRQTMVLSVANNLVNHYGVGNVDVEIVAFGPGLTMLQRNSQFTDRISILANEQGVRFSYCQITVDATEARERQPMSLVTEASSTPSGAVRIIDLVNQGYVQIAP
ncbi:MAG: hypothetical protein EA347_08380 [Thioalkalivibrio sp.]|nr:MAG: hypothetical protein EA347_08380 [Thioalkalivibrio sp.]